MSLSSDRITPRRDGIQYGRAVAAGKILYVGALACLNTTGYLVPGASDNTLIADGVAVQFADNSLGADGALTIIVDKRVHRFNNSANADRITIANIGDNCYVVDDQTVALTNGGSTRPLAGEISDVDDDGVWVKFN
jgi:hypothetical protein